MAGKLSKYALSEAMVTSVRGPDLRASIFLSAIKRVSVRLDTERNAAASRGDQRNGFQSSTPNA